MINEKSKEKIGRKNWVKNWVKNLKGRDEEVKRTIQ